MTDVKMPAYGISELGGTITQWLKDEGDSVKEGEPIVVVETEKADVELEAPASGILKQICAANGDHVEVGASLAVIEDEAGVLDKARHVHKAESSKPEEPEVSSRQEPGPGRLVAEPPADRAPGQPMTEPPIKASPSARRLAKHHGIDLSGVKGTGPRGRIVLSDVHRNFHFELPLHPKTYASYPVVSTANSSGLFEVVVGHILAVLRSRCAGFACPACLAADTYPARPLLST